MKILIIGGSGYFGSRLAEYLSFKHEIVITQRNVSDTRSFWLKKAGLKCLHYDSSKNSLIDTSESFDVIINLAVPSSSEVNRDFSSAMQKGLSVANTCFNMIKHGSAKRLIHFSTFHVYGAGVHRVFDEYDPIVPLNPYGVVHAACENLILKSSGSCVLRATNLVGMPAHNALGDQGHLLFLDICRQAVHGDIRLQNDGCSYRDFLPFADAINAVELLLNVEKIPSQIFNLSSSISVKISEVVEMVRSLVYPMPNLVYGLGVDSFRSQFYVNNQRLKSLGWGSSVDLISETKLIIDFFRESSLS